MTSNSLNDPSVVIVYLLLKGISKFSKWKIAALYMQMSYIHMRVNLLFVDLLRIFWDIQLKTIKVSQCSNNFVEHQFEFIIRWSVTEKYTSLI